MTAPLLTPVTKKTANNVKLRAIERTPVLEISGFTRPDSQKRSMHAAEGTAGVG